MTYVQFVKMVENDDGLYCEDNIIKYDEFALFCKSKNIYCSVYNIIKDGDLAKMVVICLDQNLFVGIATRDGHSNTGEYSLCFDLMNQFNLDHIKERLEQTRKYFQKSIDSLEELSNENFLNSILLRESFKPLSK